MTMSYKCLEVITMLSEEFLTEILSDEETHKCPVGTQSTMIHVVERLLEKKVEENPYATISELLSVYD